MNKKKIYKSLCLALLALPLGGVGTGLLSSCSDTWNDHYTENSIGSGTLWEALESDPSLSNFTSVLKTCGYNIQLSGSQAYTVFAPTNDNFTSEQAQELIASYNEQKNAGVKDADNSVITQFVKNQIALYRKSVSTISNDSITMLNGKYKVLGDNSLGSTEILSKNKTLANGVLFTTNGKLDYFPNVYEYLKTDNELDSVYNFISSFNKYEFEPSLSVAGSINENGETEYLDSVSLMSNTLLSELGDINAEDSTYWLLAPTNTEWARLYNEYHNYFNYANTVSKYDSLQEAMTRKAIIMGAFFNKNENPDQALLDSAKSTMANNFTTASILSMLNGEYESNSNYIYFKPFEAGGVFEGTNAITCSNGKVLKASDFRIDKKKTFCQEIKIEAESTDYQDSLVMCQSPVTIKEVSTDNPFYDKISGNKYIDVIPKNTSNDPTTWPQPQIRFNIPNTLSNMPYDVYVVFAPVEAGNAAASDEDRLPNRFSGNIYYYNKDNKLQFKRISAKQTKTGQVDSVLVASDIKFTTCGYNLSKSVVKINLISQVGRNNTTQYSNTMHIDCIILKPKK